MLHTHPVLDVYCPKWLCVNTMFLYTHIYIAWACPFIPSNYTADSVLVREDLDPSFFCLIICFSDRETRL